MKQWASDEGVARKTAFRQNCHFVWVSCQQTWYFCYLQNDVTQAPFMFSVLLKDLAHNLGSGFPQPWRKKRYVQVGVSLVRMVAGQSSGKMTSFGAWRKVEKTLGWESRFNLYLCVNIWSEVRRRKCCLINISWMLHFSSFTHLPQLLTLYPPQSSNGKCLLYEGGTRKVLWRKQR